MLRFDRQRFVAFGIPALLNALLLPGYELMTGPGPATTGFLISVALALVSLGVGIACIVKRGRDLGWSPALTLVGGVASVALMPAFLFGLLALAVGGSHQQVQGYGPPPAPPRAEIWLGSVVVALAPWAVREVLRLVM